MWPFPPRQPVWTSPSTQLSAAASQKAVELLSSKLSAPQLKSYQKHGFFLVRGSADNLYRIDTRSGITGNVRWVLEREGGLWPKAGLDVGGRFCGYPYEWPRGERLPQADLFLGQMMHLVTDENDFLNTAVLQSGSYPPSFRDYRTDKGERPDPACTCPFCSTALRWIG